MSESTQEIWTFYSAESDNRYSVPIAVAQLSGTFSTMIKSSQNEKAVSLQVVSQKLETTDKEYLINTDYLLSYVYRYFKIWEKNITGSNYVKEEPVQTSEIHHLLKKCDIDLIDTYIEEYLQSNRINEFTDKPTAVRNAKKEALGILLSQVDEFLDIKCFSNKLYAYIGTLIWNTSIADFAEAMQDPAFYAAQQAAVEAWKLDNETHFANYIRSQPVGSISLAPIVPDEQINSVEIDIEERNTIINTADLSSSDSDSEDSDYSN